MTGADDGNGTYGLELALELVGPWQPVDLGSLEALDASAVLGVDVAALNSVELPGRVVLAATMIDVPLPDEDVPAVSASLVVMSTTTAHEVRINAGGEILPEVARTTTPVVWRDASTVRLRRVTYVVPTPTGDAAAVLMFATPNLTLTNELEKIFELILSTARWVRTKPD